MNKSFRIFTAMFIVLGITFGFQSTAVAGKAEFQAEVITQMPLSLNVNSQGGITGNKQVTVSATRTQVGSSAACNKIKLLDVVEGGSPSNPSLGSLSLGRKGQCYFRNKNILIQPFKDADIIGICKNVSGVTQSLRASGLVAAHNTPWSASYLDRIRAGEVEGGLFPGPKNTQQINFAADVQCPPNTIQMQRQDDTVVLVETCNMQGWWKLTTGIASKDGEWNFTKTGSSQSPGKYAAKGPASKRNGSLIYGAGSGNATINSNKTFSWALNDRTNCKGQINAACSVVVGTCKGIMPNSPEYPFKLEKSNGPTDLGTPQSPAGTPSSSNSTYTPITAPKNPTDTFKPGPTLPTRPKW